MSSVWSFSSNLGFFSGHMGGSCSCSAAPSLHFASAASSLFEDMPELSQHDKAIIRTRYLPLLHAADVEANRAETRDTVMFAVGFLGSIIMTFSTAVSYAGYAPSNVMGVCMLIVSSVGTVSQGLRERLKFRDVARIARRLSWKLQRVGVMFASRLEPYAEGPTGFRHFISDVESVKALADQQRMQLRENDERDAGGGGVGAGVTASVLTTRVAGARVASVAPVAPVVVVTASEEARAAEMIHDEQVAV